MLRLLRPRVLSPRLGLKTVRSYWLTQAEFNNRDCCGCSAEHHSETVPSQNSHRRICLNIQGSAFHYPVCSFMFLPHARKIVKHANETLLQSPEEESHGLDHLRKGSGVRLGYRAEFLSWRGRWLKDWRRADAHPVNSDLQIDVVPPRLLPLQPCGVSSPPHSKLLSLESVIEGY